MEKLIQHESFELEFELPEILQGHLEKFETVLSKSIKSIEDVQVSVLHGSMVRAAIEVGWLEGLAKDDVEGMKPNAIAWLSARVSEHVQEAKEIPSE